MIYMVEHAIGLPALEEEWSNWCTEYLKALIAVPGISSIQRFKVHGSTPSRYMSMHSIASADIFESREYRIRGGGGKASERFRPAYHSWKRNLFASSDPAPAVGHGEVLLILDSDAPLGGPFKWLPSVGLQRSTPFRGFAVIASGQAGEFGHDYARDAVAYAPLSPPWSKSTSSAEDGAEAERPD